MKCRAETLELNIADMTGAPCVEPRRTGAARRCPACSMPRSTCCDRARERDAAAHGAADAEALAAAVTRAGYGATPGSLKPRPRRDRAMPHAEFWTGPWPDGHFGGAVAACHW
ncbi:hypothetical protein ACTMU2_00085 [Cupriavidus basilensis]